MHVYIYIYVYMYIYKMYSIVKQREILFRRFFCVRKVMRTIFFFWPVELISSLPAAQTNSARYEFFTLSFMAIPSLSRRLGHFLYYARENLLMLDISIFHSELIMQFHNESKSQFVRRVFTVRAL